MANYNTSANVVLTVNGKQAQKMLSQLQREAQRLEKGIAKAAAAGDKATMKKLQRELRNTNKMMEQLRGSAYNVDSVLRRLDKATPKDLNKALKQLQSQLGGIQRGTAAWDAHVAKIKAVKAEISRLNASMANQKSLWDRMNIWLNNCQTAIFGMAAAISGLVMAGRKAVNDYAGMEESMANTRKYTRMSAEDVAELNEVFKSMDTRIAREQLNLLAQEGGRLGYNTLESVKEYVEAASIINVALVDLGEGATQTIAKIGNIFGTEKMHGIKDSMLKIGSTVNVLSQNCTASKPYLVDFAQRMAGIGAQAGLTVPQILAFAAVLDANGQKVEMSATAMQKVIMNLANKNKEFAARLGLDAEHLNEVLRHSAKDGIMIFLEALQKLGKEVGFNNATMALAPAFKDLGLDAARVSQVLSTLAMHIDEVKWQMGEADKAFNEASSATNEYAIFNNTVQASIEKARKGVHELAIQLGERLYPLLRHIYTSSSVFLRVLNAIVSFIFTYKRELLALGVAIASYTVIAKGSIIIQKSLNVVTGAFAAVAQASKIAVLALSVAYNRLTGNVTKAEAATKLLSKTTKANPWGLIISLVAAAAVAIHSYQQRMKSAREETERQRREMEEWKKSLTDIDAASADYSSKEIARLKTLYNEATNESLAKDRRRSAAEKLQALYPDYFRNLSLEQIMVGQAKAQYDDLTESIINAARARAAAAKIEENEKEILELEDKRSRYLKKQEQQRRVVAEREANLKATHDKHDRAIESAAIGDSREMNSRDVQNNVQRIYDAQDRLQEATSALSSTTSKIDSVDSKLRNLNAANKMLANKYQVATKDSGVTVDPESPYSDHAPLDGADAGSGGPGAADKFADEKDWRERAEASARISYAVGETDYIAHTERMNEIEAEFYKKQLEHTDLTETERLKITAQWREAKVKIEEDAASRPLDAEENSYNERMAELKQFYIDGLISKETYDTKVEELDIEHQHNIVKAYKEANRKRKEAENEGYELRKSVLDDQLAQGLIDQKKYNADLEELERVHVANIAAIREGQLTAEDKLQDLIFKQTQRRQAETEKLEKDYAEMKKDYFGDNPREAQAKYDADIAMLDIVYQREIAAAGDNAAEKLRIEEAYEKAKLALKKKYNLLAEEDTRNSVKRAVDSSVEWLNSDGGKAVSGAMDTLVSGMSAIFSQLSSLMKAELEIQTAEIEKRYDAEISRAEGNSYKVRKLEKDKEKELAKAKAEANRKMFAMQVIQAVAQTATNALNAYGSAAAIPVVGYILAPIAAAMAVAAGAIQIAAIKKQQQASEAQGYAEGGFTPEGKADEVAGVVHKGEWVASHALVENPRTRPLLEALDYAQRTNTIGSIRMADVSRSITAPAMLAAQPHGGSAIVNNTYNYQQRDEGQLNETLSKLNRRLDEPFVTVNTASGNAGINKAQEDYLKLLKHKSPKK